MSNRETSQIFTHCILLKRMAAKAHRHIACVNLNVVRATHTHTDIRTNNDIREEVQTNEEMKMGSKAWRKFTVELKHIFTMQLLQRMMRKSKWRERERKKFIRITIIITSRVYKWTEGKVSRLGLLYKWCVHIFMYTIFYWREQSIELHLNRWLPDRERDVVVVVVVVILFGRLLFVSVHSFPMLCASIK